MISLAIVDDHNLYREGLSTVLENYSDILLIIRACNGSDFISQLQQTTIIPDIVLLDVQMPVMDGKQTARWLKKNHPNIKVIFISMLTHETLYYEFYAIGASGFLSKDCSIPDLLHTIEKVYNGENLLEEYVNFQEAKNKKVDTLLTEKQKEFISLCASELTYKEISDKLNISIKTADRYREDLFKKLGISSRIGLVMYALQTGIAYL
ncbi:MAG: response regulator transcription factor [Bacteroidota bacterium]|nr:response regulator transcription factor [Bacteroidota bacterium]